MCRLAAYLGDAISLQSLIIDPEHSLIQQSMEAREAKLTVNGDGFGVIWYGEFEEPGIFKNTQPAWSDQNLLSISRHIKSTSILAHVRAATDGAIINTNCHPFVNGKWAFAHNGQIGGFQEIKRILENALPDELYNARQGTTDSELLFLLMISKGLNHDPIGSIQSTIHLVLEAAHKKCIRQALKFTAVCAAKDHLIAVRFASKGKPPTLYTAQNMAEQGTIIASEPLTRQKKDWLEVEPATIVIVDKNGQKSWPIVLT